jgi:hypothetical protein
MHIMPMCFALFRTESADNWAMFMAHVFQDFPHFKTIMSDGAKGLEGVDGMFTANEKFHGRCAWHILEKNASKASFPISRYPTCLCTFIPPSFFTITNYIITVRIFFFMVTSRIYYGETCFFLP